MKHLPIQTQDGGWMPKAERDKAMGELRASRTYLEERLELVENEIDICAAICGQLATVELELADNAHRLVDPSSAPEDDR